MAMNIPRYEESTVANAPVAIPHAQALGAEAFGAGIAQGLQSVNHVAGAIVKSEQEKANLKTAQDATIFFDQLSKEADVTIKSTVGDAAFGTKDNPKGITSTTLDNYDQKALEWIQKNTDNEHQASYAEKIFQERRNTVEHSGLTHAYTEKTKSETVSYDATKSSILDRIALYATDPTKQKEYDQALQEGGDHIEAFGNTRNWSQEQLDLEYDTFMKHATKVKAVQMMTVNPAGAKTFIEENKDTLGAEYTQLKHNVDLVASEQSGINAAEVISGRLYKEDYTTLRSELFKQFGGGTSSFDNKGFKVAEAQLASNNQAIVIAKKQNLEKLEVPVWKAIIDVEKTGGKMSPRQLAAIPEYKDMITSSEPEVVRSASQIMDKVYGEHKQEVDAARAEARFNKSMAAGDKAAKTEAQRNEWLNYYANPDRVASMSEADVLRTAHTLGQYGDDLIKMHKKATSPEALADIKVEASIFKSVMQTLKIPTGKQGQVQEAMKQYLIREQQGDKKILGKDQIRAAIGAAIQEVDVNERSSFMGFDMGTGTSKKKLYEVGNPEAIVIPKDAESKIVPLLNAYGINDTPRARLKLYKEMLAVEGTKKMRGGK
jgi:ribosomal protein L25 (general stress protein Ctc)